MSVAVEGCRIDHSVWDSRPAWDVWAVYEAVLKIARDLHSSGVAGGGPGRCRINPSAWDSHLGMFGLYTSPNIPRSCSGRRRRGSRRSTAREKIEKAGGVFAQPRADISPRGALISGSLPSALRCQETCTAVGCAPTAGTDTWSAAGEEPAACVRARTRRRPQGTQATTRRRQQGHFCPRRNAVTRQPHINPDIPPSHALPPPGAIPSRAVM
jgi:hypothetical protein